LKQLAIELVDEMAMVQKVKLLLPAMSDAA
jgi:hypothetical protein